MVQQQYRPTRSCTSHVFSDGASHIQRGESPYDRTTYRYTPFLAALLARLPHREVGRYLFCVADALCGWILLRIRQQAVTTKIEERQQSSDSMRNRPTLEDSIWWLYNPLAINICTRGSAESLVVLLPVLVTVWIVLLTSARIRNSKNTSQALSCVAAVAAGVTHGVAIHAKLYPIIYSLSFMTALTPTPYRTLDSKKTATNNQDSVRCSLLRLVRGLLTPAPILFGLAALTTFGGLTYAAVHWYGPVALQEGLLYHFSRVDHRHNYSMHWYWIYLARAQQVTRTSSAGSINATVLALTGRLLLAPQLLLLLYTSLAVAPHQLALALFVQTFLFVAHNKVITAQYFTWYLCLLPLCRDRFCFAHRRVKAALVGLLGSVVAWLGAAYCLEMRGLAVHSTVWWASVVVFAANVNLLGALLESTKAKDLLLLPNQKAKAD